MNDPKIFINDKSLKKNGEAAVYVIVHLQYKSMRFNTGICVNPEKFNYKTMRVKSSDKEWKDKNLIIESCLAKMNDIFVRYRLQNNELTPDLILNEWKNPARRIDFYAFFDEILASRKREIKNQTYRNHKTAINKLKLFSPKLTFAEITPDFLERYKQSLKLKHGNDVNTIHTTMKIIRAYLNIAIRKGIIDKNPFAEVKINTANPDRVFLTSEELKKMWELYCSGQLTEKKQKILRHFLFMCFTGIRISDLKAMTTDNVISEMLVFLPQKTAGIKKKMVKVPLTIYAIRCINDEKRTGTKLFMNISEQKMNEYIKVIAGSIKIHKPLTNHSGRHTFATVFLDKTGDLASLKELLGHSKITDTMKYVHITDGMLLKQMENMEAKLFQ